MSHGMIKGINQGAKRIVVWSLRLTECRVLRRDLEIVLFRLSGMSVISDVCGWRVISWRQGLASRLGGVSRIPHISMCFAPWRILFMLYKHVSYIILVLAPLLQLWIAFYTVFALDVGRRSVITVLRFFSWLQIEDSSNDLNLFNHSRLLEC